MKKKKDGSLAKRKVEKGDVQIDNLPLLFDTRRLCESDEPSAGAAASSLARRFGGRQG